MHDPDPNFVPVHGEVETLDDGIRRIVAPNPSPMTFRGTNTFVLGEDELAVIDPGPINDAHLAAILSSVGPGQQIRYIIVTHAHLDHSPLAPLLSRKTGAPVVAFGDAQAGRSQIMQDLAATSDIGGGEGVDAGFVPDQMVAHKDALPLGADQISILHTPGHFGNHISIGYRGHLFSGDLIMGWSTTLISPPDGDLTDFRSSCDMLLGHNWMTYHPAHGAPLLSAKDRLEEVMTHRKTREAQILDCLSSQSMTASAIAQAIYTETPPVLLPAAERNVLAHLIDLTRRNIISPVGKLSVQAKFQSF